MDIEVDFEVWKKLTILRENESTTYNDVIRKLLGFEIKKREENHSEKSWITKGVSFPEGTEFRRKYKEKYYSGKINNGFLVVQGQNHSSPSSAAIAITGNNTNGWLFWECKLPGDNKWISINTLRKKRK